MSIDPWKKSEPPAVVLTPEEARELADLTSAQLAHIDAMTDEDVARHLGHAPNSDGDVTDPDFAQHLESVPDVDVRSIRQRMAMSRGVFAETFGFPIAPLLEWEQGRSRPAGPSLTLLRLLEADPEGVLRIQQKVAALAAVQLD